MARAQQRQWLREPRGQWCWLVLALTSCALVAAHSALTARTAPAGLLLVGPVLACVRLDPARTAAVAAWALLLALAPRLGHGTVPLDAEAVAYGAWLLAGGALTVRIAHRCTTLRAALERAERAARVAQEAILRPISAQLGGVRVCTRYLCAVEGASVGGDVYGVAQTPFGLRVLVGDVRGHGSDTVRLTAATVTGFRDLAYTTPDLCDLAMGLDARLRPELGAEDFVTAVFAEFAPGEVRLVNCGHPAPLRSGHRTELLEPTVPAPPLGLCPEPGQHRARLQDGDRLLFYTDGLSEARDPQGAAFPLLTQATVALAEPLTADVLDSLSERVLAHTGAGLGDDLALVLCQPTEEEVPSRPSPGARGADTGTGAAGVAAHVVHAPPRPARGTRR